MKRHVIPLILVCLLALSTGCLAYLPEDSSSERKDVALSKIPAIQQDDDFEYQGGIEAQAIGDGCISNLTVSMYSANLTRIGSVEVGKLCLDKESHQPKNLTLTAETQPAYIVIESPDFWDDQTVLAPGGYARNPESDLYSPYPITSQDQIKPTGRFAEPVPTNNSSDQLSPVSDSHLPLVIETQLLSLHASLSNNRTVPRPPGKIIAKPMQSSTRLDTTKYPYRRCGEPKRTVTAQFRSLQRLNW